MTAPRQVLPGATYLVTRRCSQRQFLLRPSKLTTEVFLYALAVAAKRWRIRVHVFCAMSNHYHLVVTDPYAQLPAFLQLFNALVARAVNASIDRWENFWDSSAYSAVELVAPGDIIDKAAYVLANPVTAGLVRTGRLWPGARSSPENIGGQALVIRRPGHFFADNGALPATAELKLTPPPGFSSAEEFAAKVQADVDERERKAAQDRGARGFLGVVAVLKQRWNARPKSREPRRSLSPRVAARDPWKRVEALARRVAFVDEYRRAFTAWRRGDRDVVFPPGTYQVRVLYDVPCVGLG